MANPQALNHSLLRPCVLHILRAAGYHSTRPSVLDTLTDLAARYMVMLAQGTAAHALLNEEDIEINVRDVRMAMQDCGALLPERLPEEQLFNGEEDTRGVDAFIAWATGKANKEIRRVALEGVDGFKEDYLTVLKKKHGTGEDTRYTSTVLGKSSEPRVIKVEGGEATSLREWSDKLRATSKSDSPSTLSSRRQSSALSSLGDMEDMEF